MNDVLKLLISRLSQWAFADVDVIPWSCPVPSFGNHLNCKVATLGLNPSRKEFMDNVGRELEEPLRRLPTLRSLGLKGWHECQSNHLDIIATACEMYFLKNPYDGWFRSLDNIIAGTGTSYYLLGTAAHLDLIPFTTFSKWMELKPRQRNLLRELSGDALGLTLRESAVRLLVLNGMTVVDNLQRLADVAFERQMISSWALPRQNGAAVKGFCYHGVIEQVGSVALGRKIKVIGYNHNIQSSYGVTSQVKAAIGKRLAQEAMEALP